MLQQSGVHVVKALLQVVHHPKRTWFRQLSSQLKAVGSLQLNALSTLTDSGCMITAIMRDEACHGCAGDAGEDKPTSSANDKEAADVEEAVVGEESGDAVAAHATARRSKPSRVAIDDFQLQLSSRSQSPEPQKKRRRRLNAEELAVADGLLGLQEASLSFG